MSTLNPARTTEATLPEPSRSDADLAKTILDEFMPFRRLASASGACGSTSCETCQAPHLDKVIAAVRQGQPVVFVLPAFPCKSPNSAKVLGHLPDMADRRALQFLNSLCQRVGQIYAPGAKIVICSDGRVFSDLIGVSDANVSAYQNEIERLIGELNLTEISTFNLDEMTGSKSFDELRAELTEQYGPSLEAIQNDVRLGAKEAADSANSEANRMFRGLTQFLVEDSALPGQTESRTAVQKKCKGKAYKVMQRSNAWTAYIEERFPQALRLSIHPQACGSRKLGIQLLGTETWMTPWHGVAVDTGHELMLMKRWEAEELGAELVHDDAGQPSHFRLADPRPLRHLRSVK